MWTFETPTQGMSFSREEIMQVFPALRHVVMTRESVSVDAGRFEIDPYYDFETGNMVSIRKDTHIPYWLMLTEKEAKQLLGRMVDEMSMWTRRR